jgi:hypothetical protein
MLFVAILTTEMALRLFVFNFVREEVFAAAIVTEAFAALDAEPKPAVAIPLWDGHTAERIINVLLQ